MSITIHKDSEGNPNGVRINEMGEDFLIDLKDSYDGEEVTFNQANSGQLPDSPMVMLLYHFGQEINEKLKEAGGSPLKGWYWSKTPAEIILGEGTSGRLIFKSSGATFNVNYNYEFFLCTDKKRKFTDLRKDEEE